MNFLRPALGKTFVARAEGIKAAKTIRLVRANVFTYVEDFRKESCATMQGTMMCLQSRE
ncbi:MAG: hypothetical protein ABR555_01130 [Pyrinomonadaceae bacterium]